MSVLFAWLMKDFILAEELAVFVPVHLLFKYNIATNFNVRHDEISHSRSNSDLLLPELPLRFYYL